MLLVPTAVDCGYWLVGGRKLCEFKVRNDGGEGRFAIVPGASWPAINFKVRLAPSPTFGRTGACRFVLGGRS